MGGLIERMGIADEVKAEVPQRALRRHHRHHRRQRRGEIGFQQVSELVHIKGIDYIGPLPADVQHITMFSTGVQAGAAQSGRRARRWRDS